MLTKEQAIQLVAQIIPKPTKAISVISGRH